MDQLPFYEKRKFDPAFPFRLWDTSFQSFSNHWHEIQELVYLRQGTMTVSVDGQAYKARAGDILVISPGLIHGFADCTLDNALTIIQFGLEIFDQSLIDLRDQAFQKLVFGRKIFFQKKMDGPLYNSLAKLVLRLREEYYARNEGYRLVIKSKLYNLALIFLRKIPAMDILPREVARRNYSRQILERVFAFIHSNYSNFGLTLDKAAAAAALSKFYFSRFFKEQTGQTFHAYLTRVRISRAEEYLTESDMPVADIAYLCGFGSVKTFNRLFKTSTGVSPSCYRLGKRNCPRKGTQPPGSFCFPKSPAKQSNF
jgi:AraC-like DNA-binding protein